ncbi:hypothetical protein ACR30T_03290 [Neisseria gonorrhoeae]
MPSENSGGVRQASLASKRPNGAIATLRPTQGAATRPNAKKRNLAP